MIDDDSLWEGFAAESEEHLDTIERLLSGPVGTAGADKEGVNTLFRAFHSLKGMSSVLGAGGMRDVAHGCEDLLGLARAGKLAVTGGVADGLTAAVDTLRGLRGRVLESRRDAPADAALLRRLAALAEGEGPTPAPAAPLPTKAAPAAADPLLGAYASRCAAAAPLLAGLSAGRDPAALAEAADLAAAAQMLRLPGLAEALDALVADAPDGLPALGRLRRRLVLLAARAGETAGAEAIPRAARGRVDTPALAAAAEALASPPGGHHALSTAARDAAAAACALGQDALERALLALEDLADRAADPDAAAVLAARGPALAEAIRHAGNGGTAPVAAGEGDSRIPAGFLPLLSETARQRAASALDAGARLYVARLAMGQGEALEAAIADALRPEADILGSRTLPGASPPLLELLLASAGDLETLSRAGTAADPSRRVLLSLAAAEEEGSHAPATAGGTTMRVRHETIDGLISLEAEVRAASLALAEALRESAPRNAIARLSVLAGRLDGPTGRELTGLADRLRGFEDALEEAESRLSFSLRRLDEAVMELRVVPIGTLFARLPRVARAVAEPAGKEVEVVLEGQDVAIDRALVENLADPLLHLLRNAVDHGIELPADRRAAGKPPRAVIRVSAARRAGGIRVRVSDDGRGIHHGRVLARALERGLVAPEEAPALSSAAIEALLFRPGFSTAETITDTSGRGVGLDVVQEAARRAGGTLEVASTPGRGTSFTLRLPFTAATQSVLLVEVGGHPYAIPAARVEAVMEGEGDGRPVLPLAPLLGLPPSPMGAVVVARAAAGLLAIGVDRVQRRADLLLRPLHPALARLPGVGGVGVLGNGAPVLLLEPDGMGEGITVST
ncbi:ATP-binding protein [Pararoseomonas indoligenes]|uniref:Chemotaxis protein CheA n=1 Tax=Roseomonas indoligenes TaxID=2820811 RepID=A0A940MST2_9PROT|nr:ATP-binding protein [Pararoseomonas indoligenes]MBP0493443.1 Hpt domain-containing protein [Pararoseomonas indoligenes]